MIRDEDPGKMMTAAFYMQQTDKEAYTE